MTSCSLNYLLDTLSQKTNAVMPGIRDLTYKFQGDTIQSTAER